FTASKVFWGIGVIRRFRFSVGLGKMDNIDGVGGIGGNGGIGGLKPTLQPALHLPCSLPYAHAAHPTPAFFAGMTGFEITVLSGMMGNGGVV
ncbi:TPA: hypothetical protein ACJJJN_001954, partial [Neisseria meningitidis]